MTLAEARQHLHPHIAGGVSVNDPRVVHRINEARERLFSLSDFKGKKARYRFCAFQNCITLPRELETCLGVRVDEAVHHVRPQWFEYQDNGPGIATSETCGNGNILDRGDGWPCFRDICTPTQLRVYADLPEDAGAKLTVMGIDDDTSQEVMTSVSGSWQMGEQIGINNATPQTSIKTFKNITGVRKPTTNGIVRLYGVVPADDTSFTDLATFLNEDDETETATGDASDVFTVTASGWLSPSAGPYVIVMKLSSTPGAYDVSVWRETGEFIAGTGAPITNGQSFNVVDFLVHAENTAVTFTFSFSSAPAGTYLLQAEQTDEPDVLTLLGIFHPDDTVPTHRRYYVPGLELRGDIADGVPVSAICQRRYVAIRRDSDLVFPGNLAALKNMVLSLEHEARGNLNAAAAHEAKAIGYLRKELKQHYGAGMVATLNIQMGGNVFSGLR